MQITLEQFQKLFPANKNPATWVNAINAILPKYAIDQRLRLAAFLSQCGHESDGFTDLTENLNYSADALAATWPNRYAVDPKARVKIPNALAKRLARNPEAIANNCYANRMGNGPEESGDGWRFRGYGPIQGTGRAVREQFAKAIGKVLDESEAYLLTPEGGIEFACWFWVKVKNINPLADKSDVLGITRLINGGTIGLADRKARYDKAVSILKEA